MTPSHFSGVVINTSAFFRARWSGVESPVNSSTERPIDRNFGVQSRTLSLANAFKGAT